VIDTGVDFSHPDLEDRVWTNQDEVPDNKTDDDGNGYVDDVKGWDFCRNDNTVYDPVAYPQHDTYGHGTHVAGTIAASANGQGTVGVAPNVKIMALRVCGWSSDFVEALEYATNEGVGITNYSWTTNTYSQAAKDAIEASGQLFVAPAGNYDNNNDLNPQYPASYDSPNVLSVAGINSSGNRSYSNYGPASVDISAPGRDILSTFPEIPPAPAVALSGVGSSGGKALTTGFGAEEIADPAKRASFFTKAFAALGRGSQQVVLVDDDLSDTSSLPDAGGPLFTAIQSATGTAPEVITVPELYDGPDLSRLSGKTVVWATGWASYSTSNPCFGCAETRTNLLPNDQRTLIDFLNGGGKLILTGTDVLTGTVSSELVRNDLKLLVTTYNSLHEKKAFNGSQGTAFAGASYDLSTSLSLPSRHDVLVPIDSAAIPQGTYPGAPQGWRYMSGTSMAAAHAAGVAALVASQYPNLRTDPAALKQSIMDSGKPAPATAGGTVTGDMVDAEAALLGVSNRVPAGSEANVPPGTNVTVTFLRDMDPTTLNSSTFTLKAQGSTMPVEATVGYDPSSRIATLDPASRLEALTTYTATVKGGNTGAKDLAGNPLARDLVWSFTTAAPPRVIAYTPTRTTGVPRDTRPTATFYAISMDEATITATNIKLQVYKTRTKTWAEVAHTVDYDAISKKATVVPDTRLGASRRYRVTVTTRVKSSAGVALDQDYSIPGNQSKWWTFTTGSS
jgi:subtilisin family serine protease